MSVTAEILAQYNRREGELIQDNSLDRIPALGPKPQNSHGSNATDEIKPEIENEEATTTPGCPAQVGNCDIKGLNQKQSGLQSQTCPGAIFSVVGDSYFSRADAWNHVSFTIHDFFF